MSTNKKLQREGRFLCQTFHSANAATETPRRHKQIGTPDLMLQRTDRQSHKASEKYETKYTYKDECTFKKH